MGLSTVQVRLSAARQRKLEAIAAAREEAYAKYANIYKDHAAERYARAIEAARQDRGGVEAYRRRVVAASTDAQRYRGYVEATEKEEEEEEEIGGRELGLLLENSGSISSGFAVPSSSKEGSSGGAGLAQGESRAPSVVCPSTNRESTGDHISATGGPAAVGKGRGSAAEDGAAEAGPGDGAAPEGSAALASGGGGFAEGGPAPAATRKGRGGVGGGRGSFTAVVPFDNIRAKYLRPLDDTELSRPYHVAPRPDWRADRAGRSGSLGSSACSPSTAGMAASIDSAASEKTMEAYRRTKQRGHVTHQRRGKTLNSKERETWGAE